MPYEKVAEGSIWNLGDIGDYEDRFKEGETGELRINLRSSLPGSVVDSIRSTIQSHGKTCSVWQSSSSPAILYFRFKKSIAWLPIILIAIAVIAFILITGWSLYKVTGMAPETIWLLLVAAGAVVLVLYLRRGG